MSHNVSNQGSTAPRTLIEENKNMYQLFYGLTEEYMSAKRRRDQGFEEMRKNTATDTYKEDRARTMGETATDATATTTTTTTTNAKTTEKDRDEKEMEKKKTRNGVHGVYKKDRNERINAD
jgi:hypothetical protein